MVSNLAQNLSDKLEHLSDSSRVWIWQTNQPLTEVQVDLVQRNLSLFINQWTSHNQELNATGLVENKRFIIVCLDQEASSAASGCSIDSLTQAIQLISKSIEIDLFDRNLCYYLDENEIRMVKLNDLGELKVSGIISDSTSIFDPLLNTKSKLLSEWPKPIGESWHRRFM